MNNSTPFSQLRPGDRARVAGFSGLPESYQRQLLSLGITPGVEFRVQQIAPLGDPIKIMVRGFRLSLRREEASGILVEKV